MANTKELQIQALLDGAGKAGPELTHRLSELGGGKMSNGLVGLWKAGQHNGVIKGVTITTLVFSAAIGGYILIKNAIEDRQMKKALSEIQKSTVNHSADDESFASGTEIQNATLVQVVPDEE